MPTLRFPIERGAPDRLAIKSGPFAFSRIKVLFDEQPVLTGLTPKQVTDGATAALPDGSVFYIRNIGGLLKGGGLQLFRNGTPLPGSIGTREYAALVAKGVGKLFYTFAGITLCYGLFVELSGIDPIWRADAGWAYFLSATALAVLGYFIHRKQSLIALTVAILFLLFDTIATFGMQVVEGQMPNAGFLVVRAFIVIMLIGAFRNIRQHKWIVPTA